jgi:hypothetical protein
MDGLTLASDYGWVTATARRGRRRRRRRGSWRDVGMKWGRRCAAAIADLLDDALNLALLGRGDARRGSRLGRGLLARGAWGGRRRARGRISALDKGG